MYLQKRRWRTKTTVDVVKFYVISNIKNQKQKKTLELSSNFSLGFVTLNQKLWPFQAFGETPNLITTKSTSHMFEKLFKKLDFSLKTKPQLRLRFSKFRQCPPSFTPEKFWDIFDFPLTTGPQVISEVSLEEEKLPTFFASGST